MVIKVENDQVAVIKRYTLKQLETWERGNKAKPVIYARVTPSEKAELQAICKKLGVKPARLIEVLVTNGVSALRALL